VTRQSIIATLGAGAGWAATLSLHDIAAAVAALATATWMVAQTYVLLRRQKCTATDCPHRKP